MVKQLDTLPPLEIGMTNTQKTLIAKHTPKRYIRTRPGPGGKQLRYVEASYMIAELNRIFNHMWDFVITEQEIGQGQIWVRGQLIGKIATPFGVETITKSQYGSALIKKGALGSLNIGNDLKAASSDALKKCASLLGIAADIYGNEDYIDDVPKKDNLTSEATVEEYYASSPPEVTMCAVHNETTRLYRNNDKAWYGHKLPDGTWCNKVI